MYGPGKTGKALKAQCAMNFALERKRCTGGAIYVNLEGADSCHEVLKLIYKAVLECDPR